MSQYMLMLYAPEAESAAQAEREARLPLWQQLDESLREAGLLVSSQRLHSPESATSVRVRGGQTEITDGPFAMTKEFLAGYYVLECADLDEALKHAARLPLANYGTVEVRPIMTAEEWHRRARAAGVDVPDPGVSDQA